jgi:hypothetical protein
MRRTAAAAKVAETDAGFLECLAEHKNQRAKYFLPPTVEKGEEIRMRFEVMTDARKGEMLASISKGENDDALRALAADWNDRNRPRCGR